MRKGNKLIALISATAVLLSGLSGITASAAENAQAVMPTREQAVEAVERANDRWITVNKTHNRSFWDNAAYHTGNMEAYFLTGIEAYRQYSDAWSNRNQWKGATSTNRNEWTYSYDESMKGVLFGDWQICFQTYVDLYNAEVSETKGQTRDNNKIARAREVMEYEMSTPKKDYWWWADALYMVMPVMTKLYLVTENEQYLDKLTEYFVYARDEIPSKNGSKNGMFDREYNLFHRDGKYIYPDHKTDNGKKDFWARGSGWVFAGLAKVLSDMPTDYKNRNEFLDTYQLMAQGVKNAQQPEGFWSRSMIDRAHADGLETSGTAFFTYGLAWGINSGYLDRATYLDTCLKGWYFLYNTALQENGVVGYVQPIGENSKQSLNIGANNTANFGVGAFLLAASEISKLAGGIDGDIYPYLQKKMVGNIALELNAPHVYKDGKIHHMDESDHKKVTYDSNGELMVYAQGVADKLGATVNYDAANSTITLVKPMLNGTTTTDRVVAISIGSNTYTVDGAAKQAAANAELKDNVPYVPLSMIADGLGYHIYKSENTLGTADQYALFVVSKKVDPFFACEANAVEMLRYMIGPTEHYPTRPAQPEKAFALTSNTKATGTKVALNASMASSTQTPEAQNGPTNVVDGNMGTFFACNGAGDLILNMGTTVSISSIGIGIRAYDDGRTVSYTVSTSPDGRSYSNAFTATCTPGGGMVEYKDVTASAQYVKVSLNGSSTNQWASLSEVEVYSGTGTVATGTIGTGTTATETIVQGGVTLVPPTSLGTGTTGSKINLTAAMVTASQTPEAANVAANVVDGNPGTVWAAEGAATLTIDLGTAQPLSQVGVQMKQYDDTRTLNYTVSTSADGTTYTDAFSKTCPPGGGVMELGAVSGSARYVRLSVSGNSVSNWASVAEVAVYGGGGGTAVTTPVVTPTTPSVGGKIALRSNMVTASQTPEAANVAANVVDGNAGTVWAAEGAATLTIDLGAEQALSQVGVLMKKYDDTRTLTYTVSTSTDGSSYKDAFSKTCPPGGGVMELGAVSGSARYVRLSVNGNSVSNWASVAEIEVYGAGGGTGSTAGAVSPMGQGTIPKPLGGAVKATDAVTMILANKTLKPENMIDASKSSSWQANKNHSAVITLAKEVTVTSIGLTAEADAPFTVYGSIDGSDWVELCSGVTTGGTSFYSTTQTKASYIQIQLGATCKVYDLTVYGG